MDKQSELREKIATLMDVCCDCCLYGGDSSKPENCFNTPETTPCRRRLDIAGQILAKIKDSGCVWLDEDQSLSCRMYVKHNPVDAYGQAQQDMLKAGWRKIKQER